MSSVNEQPQTQFSANTKATIKAALQTNCIHAKKRLLPTKRLAEYRHAWSRQINPKQISTLIYESLSEIWLKS